MQFKPRHPVCDILYDGLSRPGGGYRLSSSSRPAPTPTPAAPVAPAPTAPGDDKPSDILDFRKRFEALMGREPDNDELLDAAVRFGWLP